MGGSVWPTLDDPLRPGGTGVGQLLLLPVRAEWQFVFPAMCCGFGHALLFPAVVSMGSGKFPVQYRGTGPRWCWAAWIRG